MVKDLDTYLKELQVSMATSGADRALIQDALFDAEEYQRAEMAERYEGEPSSVEAYQKRFVAVAEDYGTPEEVAAAYLGGPSAPVGARAGEATAPTSGGAGPAPGGTASSAPQPSAAPVPPAPPTPPTPPAEPAAPPTPGGPTPSAGEKVPVGVAAGAAAAAAAAGASQPSVWRRFFGAYGLRDRELQGHHGDSHGGGAFLVGAGVLRPRRLGLLLLDHRDRLAQDEV